MLSEQRKWEKSQSTKIRSAILFTTAWGPACSVSCTVGLLRGFCPLTNLPKHATPSNWFLGSSHGHSWYTQPVSNKRSLLLSFRWGHLLEKSFLWDSTGFHKPGILALVLHPSPIISVTLAVLLHRYCNFGYKFPSFSCPCIIRK